MLTDAVAELLTDRPGVFGFYARNLDTGETVAVNADRVLPAESAAKIFILVEYCRRVSSGALDPQQRVWFDDDSRYIGTGVLRFLSAGLEPTIDDLAWLMVIVSDNTATAMLLRAMDTPPDVINAAMRQLGYPTAQLNAITFEAALAGAPFSLSTPRDLAEVYTQLDDRARSMLFRQQNLIGLPRRVPHLAMAADIDVTMPVRVFNKTGNGAGTFIDSGLFETEDVSWVVAAMASEQPDFACRPDDLAPAMFGELGALLYDAWALPSDP